MFLFRLHLHHGDAAILKVKMRHVSQRLLEHQRQDHANDAAMTKHGHAFMRVFLQYLQQRWLHTQ